MGFSEDPEKFISDMKADIARNDCGEANEIQYWYKKFQVLMEDWEASIYVVWTALQHKHG